MWGRPVRLHMLRLAMRFFRPNVQRMQDKKDVAGLVRALTDAEAEIRDGAARALGQMGYVRAVMPLCRCRR